MKNDKKYYRRPTRSLRSHKRRHDKVKEYVRARPRKQVYYGKPKIDPELKSVFNKIGVPEPRPFKADLFQLEALELIRDYDVLVSAPTGSGKTWIASQTIHSYLAEDLNVWYASPLKALSNSIYQEFCHEFGPTHCGILTGDRKENPEAPIIVGTTEILRNQLYDAMHEGTSIRADLVILDEAHYLSDPERGVVWEEVLIYLPSTVKLLLLSATISNAEEVCTWLREIRGTPNRVVRSEERPVPMEMLFLFNEGLIVPLFGRKGLSPKVKRFMASKGGGHRRRPRKLDFGKIIKQLRYFDLLPAIFFLKSRSDCDRAISTCPPVEMTPRMEESFKVTLARFLREYPHLKGHQQMGPLLESRVGAHHGGQLPYWKVLVEKMMSKGYLEAIFSTSTVAAGVNFPARTVVLVQSDRYNGREFIDLTATDFHQMIGRAGRRGKDYIGFGVVIPGIYQDPQLIYELKDSPAEPLLSQIHINFSMTLNLLLSHTPQEVKDLLDLSFASFQEKKKGPLLKREWNKRISELRKIVPEAKCDISDPYEILENIQKRLELKKEVRHVTQSIRYKHLLNAYKNYLKPGRLFLHKNNNIYIVFNIYEDHGKFICAAHNIKRLPRTRKSRFRLKKVDLNQIKGIYSYRADFPENYSPERLKRIIHNIVEEDLKILNIEVPAKDAVGGEELSEINRRLDALPCETCAYTKTCHKNKKAPLIKLLRDLQSLGMQMEGIGGGLWLSFKRHMRFLRETGFVDEWDTLTTDGYWASKLRLDQPLLIAEAIREGAFDGVSSQILAGGLAPFVWDRTLEVELRVDGILNLSELEERFNSILEHIGGIRDLKSKRGFESPPLLFWPAAALFMWAKNVPWEQLLTYVPVDEGDMASLIMRTADHLRQVVNLHETHPQLAAVAEHAIELILREPVYIQ